MPSLIRVHGQPCQAKSTIDALFSMRMALEKRYKAQRILCAVLLTHMCGLCSWIVTAFDSVQGESGGTGLCRRLSSSFDCFMKMGRRKSLLIEPERRFVPSTTTSESSTLAPPPFLCCIQAVVENCGERDLT